MENGRCGELQEGEVVLMESGSSVGGSEGGCRRRGRTAAQWRTAARRGKRKPGWN
jgi:hypothetical protein